MKRKILLFIFTLILVISGITSISAYDKYDGDYTIEYLLRNYNVVTFGTKDRYNYSLMPDIDKTKGSVSNVFDIGGPVLIRGNYTGSTNLKWDNEFAQKTNCIPSYIKGKIGDKIKAGSIESAELSNIYVGSSNKVTSNDEYYTVNNDTYKYKYPVKVSDDYLDFDKLYAAVVNEQKIVDSGRYLTKEKTDYKSEVNIYTPGTYTISDITEIKDIKIQNYDINKLYVININEEYIYSMPIINITKNGKGVTTDDDAIFFGRTDDNETYGGNIIFNFPNARYLHLGYSTIGHIIAPQADVELAESHYPGAIIANSVSALPNMYTTIQFYPYSLDEKIVASEGKTLVKEETEINTNDLYNGNYSIDELLKNYSVITLGTKAYGSNTKLSTLTDTQGTASIFHIAGQFLINGNLTSEKIYYQRSDYNGIRLDLKTGDISVSSYLKGNLRQNAYDEMLNDYFSRKGSKVPIYSNTMSPAIWFGSNNEIKNWQFSSSFYREFSDSHPYTKYIMNGYNVGPRIINDSYYMETIHSSYISDNYIDFTTLYDAIVAQQKRINEGSIVKPDESNVIHIPIGGNYTIEGINEASRIVFDNYSENKNKLTIVTINDGGSINFPFEASDTWSNVMTNDWYGKDKITYASETIQPETYYGNIVFNIPNATYIKLAGSNSFKGHIIAPNADIETLEMNFAGAMICNSLYTEGHTEAHFYPLTVGSVGTGIEKETETIGSDEVDKISISVTKTWDDNNNQDGLRPESVTINLLANGEKIDSVTITESDNWKYSFNVPRVDENGVKINYTITEDAIEHYSTNIESFSNDNCPNGCKVSIDGYNITNSYTPKKTSLTVNKVWKDENNADKLRPESVEVELYANGKKVTSTTLNEENNWTYIFNEIDMNENGKKIEYTVKEKEKIKGYTTEITGDQETGYTITNTHVVKKVNPTTGDNIKKFLSISIISAGLLALSIILLTKYRRKKA